MILCFHTVSVGGIGVGVSAKQNPGTRIDITRELKLGRETEGKQRTMEIIRRG